MSDAFRLLVVVVGLLAASACGSHVDCLCADPNFIIVVPQALEGAVASISVAGSGCHSQTVPLDCPDAGPGDCDELVLLDDGATGACEVTVTLTDGGTRTGSSTIGPSTTGACCVGETEGTSVAIAP